MNAWKIRLLLLALALVVGPPASDAAANLPCPCGSLGDDALARVETLGGKIHPHDCCDADLWTCLHAEAPSRLVVRMGSALCRRVSERETDAEILREFERHAASMLGTGRSARIDTADLSWAGAVKAPVEVVVYTCARCPFCAKSVPAMHEAVTDGALEGKARLGLRIFPVKGHPHSAEGGVAFQAALELGKFWSYVLEVYRRFDDFSPDRLGEWAAGVGMARGAFEESVGAPATRKRVVASKKEGLRNQVRATPTYFINGKLYQGDMSDWALEDAILEEHDRTSDRLCAPL